MYNLILWEIQSKSTSSGWLIINSNKWQSSEKCKEIWGYFWDLWIKLPFYRLHDGLGHDPNLHPSCHVCCIHWYCNEWTALLTKSVCILFPSPLIPHFHVLLICHPIASLFLSWHLFRYVYELEASTGGGTSVSDKYVIRTPVSCPTGIQPPHSITVMGPNSISLAWNPPGE